MCSRNPHHNGSVQFSRSVVFHSLWPDGLQHCQVSLSITNCQSFLKLMSIKSVMPSNHLILCHPLILLPSIFPSIRVFSNESVLRIKWPEYCSFSFSISPSNEYSGLTSFRIDWLDLFTVQGTLKALLQHHSSKASILQCSAFFCVCMCFLFDFFFFSFLYSPTLTSIHTGWKNHSLDYTDLCWQSNVSAF